MKNTKNVIVLALTLAALCGCNKKSDTSTKDWTEEQKSLILEWCGEVIPYPQGMLNDDITIYQAYDNNYQEVLQIFDTSTSFTLKDYYKELAEDNWNVITDYNGNSVQDSDGALHVEATKIGEIGEGLDITYFFDEGQEATEWEEAVPAGNVIWLYNSLGSTVNSDTTWNETDASYINSTLTTSLPMLPLGNYYTTYQRSEDVLVIYDNYVNDLCKETSDLLVKNGFTLSSEQSKKYNMYVLAKENDDGSAILATLMYTTGNYYQFMYIPDEHTSTTWPTSLFTEVTNKTGITIPSFEATDIKEYIYWSKNNSYYVQAETSDESILSTYSDALTALGFAHDFGVYTNWEENLSIVLSYAYDEETFAMTALQVCVTLLTPTSTFSSTWPSQAITSTFNKLGVTVDIPTLSSIPETGRDLKYTVQDNYDTLYDYWYSYIVENPWIFDGNLDVTDEEAVKQATIATIRNMLGVFMEIYDPENEAYDAYVSTLTNAAWHKEMDDYGQVVFEDAAGNVAISIANNNSVTSINMTLGSGKAHTPTLKFAKDEITLGINTTTKIDLIQDMIPGEVTLTCDDTNNNVTIVDGNIVIGNCPDYVGSFVTITATIEYNGQTYTDTLKVNIALTTPYTYQSAAEKVAELYNEVKQLTGEDAIAPTYDDYDDCWGFELNLSDAVSAEETKSLVNESLVPSGFTQDGDWSEETSEYGDVVYTITYVNVDDGVSIVYKVTSTDGTILLSAYAYNLSSSNE